MNAAETSASSAIADWTPLTVVPRSWTTAAIETFINDVSTTSTNIAAARRIARRGLVAGSSWTGVVAPSDIGPIMPDRTGRVERCTRSFDDLFDQPKEDADTTDSASEPPRRVTERPSPLGVSPSDRYDPDGTGEPLEGDLPFFTG